MTIEQHIREVHKRGLRINNLFERADGNWQCNLRSRAVAVVCFEFAVAHSPEEAIRKALAAANAKLEASGKAKIIGIAVAEDQAAVTVPLDDDDLIGGAPPAAQEDEDLIG